MEKITEYACPRCGRVQMNVYFSDESDSKVGAWCEYCDLKAYFQGERLVPISPE